ncbi:MAG: beta-aspartyl-peptidase [Calditrichaeota bacterium]|nr:beta-aspartyl-peptidase [Calditrichota bacterium]
MSAIKLIKKARVYAPEPLGVKDVLIAGNKIAAIDDHIEIASSVEIRIIEGADKFLVPGFIDSHVHIVGGGGEGGYRTRTPEIMLSDIISAGVTTVVGCLGTDGSSRNMANLIAKAGALEEEGITCYVYTGSYQVPVRTVTGSILDDLVLIDKIIGVGEIAISDHRSSQPTKTEIAKIAAQARVGGMLSGKAGIVNVHVGAGRNRLKILEEIITEGEIPPAQFLPTHLARTPELFASAINYARLGGLIDITTSTPARYLPDKKGSAANALKSLLEHDVPIEQISFSSDGQGSLPVFDAAGKITGLKIGKVKTLFDEFRKAVSELNIPPELALQPVTSNPARNLNLSSKGKIKVGTDADLLLLDRDFRLHSLLANGKIMMTNKKINVKGTFEDD